MLIVQPIQPRIGVTMVLLVCARLSPQESLFKWNLGAHILLGTRRCLTCCDTVSRCVCVARAACVCVARAACVHSKRVRATCASTRMRAVHAEFETFICSLFDLELVIWSLSIPGVIHAPRICTSAADAIRTIKPPRNLRVQPERSYR